jgi:hypothetical protein
MARAPASCVTPATRLLFPRTEQVFGLHNSVAQWIVLGSTGAEQCFIPNNFEPGGRWIYSQRPFSFQAKRGREMRGQDTGFDFDRYQQLLAEADDEAKRLALIDVLIQERAKQRLETQRASDRVAMTATTIAKVLGTSAAQ